MESTEVQHKWAWMGEDKADVQNQFFSVIHGHRAVVSHIPGPIFWSFTLALSEWA